jgi:hypothetical protein
VVTISRKLLSAASLRLDSFGRTSCCSSNPSTARVFALPDWLESLGTSFADYDCESSHQLFDALVSLLLCLDDRLQLVKHTFFCCSTTPHWHNLVVAASLIGLSVCRLLFGTFGVTEKLLQLGSVIALRCILLARCRVAWAGKERKRPDNLGCTSRSLLLPCPFSSDGPSTTTLKLAFTALHALHPMFQHRQLGFLRSESAF